MRKGRKTSWSMDICEGERDTSIKTGNIVWEEVEVDLTLWGRNEPVDIWQEESHELKRM